MTELQLKMIEAMCEMSPDEYLARQAVPELIAHIRECHAGLRAVVGNSKQGE